MLENRTVLVTGATGFLGGALCRRLSAEGVKVRALARRPGRDRHIRDLPNVEIVMGDMTDRASLAQAMAGCTVAFHVAAALDGPIALQRQINVEGTRNLAQEAAQAGIERLVHVSSIAVYGFTFPSFIDADDPYTPNAEAYSLTKAEAEDALRAVARSTGLDYAIIRPGGIYGPRSALWTVTLFRLARRVAPLIGGGRGTCPLIFIEDVVDLMLVLARHPQASQQAFNAVMAPPPTWREVLLAYAGLAGHQRHLTIPSAFVQGLLQAARILAGPHSRRATGYEAARIFIQPTQYDMEKAVRLLGWRPGTSLPQGMAACADYLRERGYLT